MPFVFLSNAWGNNTSYYLCILKIILKITMLHAHKNECIFNYSVKIYFMKRKPVIFLIFTNLFLPGRIILLFVNKEAWTLTNGWEERQYYYPYSRTYWGVIFLKKYPYIKLERRSRRKRRKLGEITSLEIVLHWPNGENVLFDPWNNIHIIAFRVL